MPFVVRILLAWAIDAAALAIAAWIFTGISVGGSAGTLIFAALVYGVLATFVKPLLKLLTLPLAILTLGIAWFFVAMFILWLTDVIVSGLHIDGFWDSRRRHDRRLGRRRGGRPLAVPEEALKRCWPILAFRARLNGKQRRSMRSAPVARVRDVAPPGRPRLNLPRCGSSSSPGTGSRSSTSTRS